MQASSPETNIGSQMSAEPPDGMAEEKGSEGQTAPSEQAERAAERQELDRLLKLMLAGHKPV